MTGLYRTDTEALDECLRLMFPDSEPDDLRTDGGNINMPKVQSLWRERSDRALMLQLALRFGVCVGKGIHGGAYVGYPGTKDVVLTYDEGTDPAAAELAAVAVAAERERCIQRCKSVAFDECHEWRRDAVERCVAAIQDAAECQTEAEKTAYAFGWWKAMEARQAWKPWTGDYEKRSYDVWVKGCDVVLGCWPNAGRMCATDGSGRQWKPGEVLAVRVSEYQGRFPRPLSAAPQDLHDNNAEVTVQVAAQRQVVVPLTKDEIEEVCREHIRRDTSDDSGTWPSSIAFARAIEAKHARKWGLTIKEQP